MKGAVGWRGRLPGLVKGVGRIERAKTQPLFMAALSMKAAMSALRRGSMRTWSKNRPEVDATAAKAVPVAGSTMTLPDKVARIKRALDLDEALSLPAAIKAANEMMNLPDTGGLLAQAGALMAALRLEG